MKKFLFDTNSLTRDVLKDALKRRDLFLLQEVVDEWAGTDEEYKKVISSGIQIVHLEGRHLEKLKMVMGKYGDNFELIRLYTGEGTADVLMLAYILCEQEAGGMFPDKWIIVTDDKALKGVAFRFGINCVSMPESLRT